jgi:membrane protein
MSSLSGPGLVEPPAAAPDEARQPAPSRRRGRPADGWRAAVRDYARRIWVASGEDNLFFLAGGIAFNILLAAVPFTLLILAGVSFALRVTPDATLGEVLYLVDRFLPPHSETADAPIHRLISDILSARGTLGLYGSITYVWFSTRLFGSLRSVLADVFDIESDRGIIGGKWFDVRMTVYSTVLLVAYLVLNAYLAIATTHGVNLLAELGIRPDVMGTLEYLAGRVLAFVFIVAIFFALYKYLPNRRVRWQQALVGSLTSSLLFELARNIWTAYTASFDPGSFYSGTLYGLISLVFWTYYAALIFLLGGEVAQAHELRRVRRLQREVFE